MTSRDALIDAARDAMRHAYAPYSGFSVGAAVELADGALVMGANMENASYGLSLCAETVACAAAAHGGRRGGLIAIAVAGGPDGLAGEPVAPCGRCRQVLHEQAALGGTDPLVLMIGADETRVARLSALLPQAFGPAYLAR